MIASKTTEWHYNNLCKEIQRYVKWTLEKECLFLSYGTSKKIDMSLDKKVF